MKNQTIQFMLVLTGLSDLPELHLPLFHVFLFIYLMTLIGNILVLLLIFTDYHLHTPMYFFLGTLACLDISYSSVTSPRMLFALLTDGRILSVQACITQIFFFIFCAVSELSMLAVMSYDRYIAICRPLHYMQIMNWKVCVQLVSAILFFGLAYAFKIMFCSSHDLQSFFCDIPQLLQISCSGTFLNIMLIFLSGVSYGFVIFGVTFYPYITIIGTILKIPSKYTRSKAFSTCSSHLTVVFIFYSTSIFNYFHSSTHEKHDQDKIASVFYAILIPFLNPVIYSLRNQELKISLRRTLQKL